MTIMVGVEVEEGEGDVADPAAQEEGTGGPTQGPDQGLLLPDTTAGAADHLATLPHLNGVLAHIEGLTPVLLPNLHSNGPTHPI